MHEAPVTDLWGGGGCMPHALNIQYIHGICSWGEIQN